MDLVKKVLSNIYVKCLLIFIFVFYVYVKCNMPSSKPMNIWLYGYLFYLIPLVYVFHHLYKRDFKTKHFIYAMLMLGIFLRVNYAAYNNIYSRQHDVGQLHEYNHFGYALYIFRNNSLPDTNIDQFYQPPLNAIMQAIFMKFYNFLYPINSAFEADFKLIFNGELTFPYTNEVKSHIEMLYNSTRILSAYYSILILIFAYKLIKLITKNEIVISLTVAYMAIQPVLVMMSGTMNNDVLSYVFFFASLYLAVKWFKNPSYLTSILLAISIGLGMITKLSIGFVALPIAIMMLFKLYQSFKEKKPFPLIAKLAVFGVIVFPLGLSFALRNYIKFDQSFTYILDFGRDSWLHELIKDKNIFERFLSLPIDRFTTEEYGVFHDYQEWNIWVDLIKTSVFEEFSYTQGAYQFIAVLFPLNTIIMLLALPCGVYVCYKEGKYYFQNKKISEDFFLTFISITLSLLALVSYVSLCIKMPYGCTSNFRYIAYYAFAIIILIALTIKKINNKHLTEISYLFMIIFALYVCLFILNI